MSTTTTDACPGCGALGTLRTTRMPEGHPHWAQTECTGCGKWLRWEPKPMDRARARGYVMHFGKCVGSSLGDLFDERQGQSYLRWLVTSGVATGTLLRAIEWLFANPDTPDPADAF